MEDRTLLSALPTTTGLAASAISPLYGQSETLTATVAPVFADGSTPGGTVTFFDGTTPLVTVPVVATAGIASATLSTSSLSVGTHSIVATYNGDARFAGSDSRTISRVAGDYAQPERYTGDGGPATEAGLSLDYGSFFTTTGGGGSAVAADTQGNLYISDPGNAVIRKVDSAGIITTVAGGGPEFDPNFNGPATDVLLGYVNGLAADENGNLFISDMSNNVIRLLRPDGSLRTIAGNGTPGYSGDGGPATAATLNAPTGLGLGPQGDLFIADTSNLVVRRLRPDGTISTAVSLIDTLGIPTDVEADGLGNLYVADTRIGVVHKVLPDGTMIRYAGNGNLGDPNDGGPATAASIWDATGLALDAQGNLYITDTGHNVVREVHADGTITTVAGRYLPGNGGDGGPATSAELFASGDVALDRMGNLYIADSYNNVVRKVSGLDLNVAPVTASNLQDALDNSSQAGAGGTVTILTSSNDEVSTAVEAVNGLSSTNPGTPVTVTLDLGGQTFTTDTHVNAMPGVTLVIVNGTLVGGSPALIVDSGVVLLDGVTALNATNAPTIVVNGGTLRVRNSTIHESSGYLQTAILVNGGNADFGTAEAPGNNVFRVEGLGLLIVNASALPVTAVGNSYVFNGTALTSLYRVEDLIIDRLDLGGRGLVTLVPGHVYVTGLLGSIQNAVDAVSPGGTVNVEGRLHGDYQVGVKPLTVAFEGGPSLSLRPDPQASGKLSLFVAGTTGADGIQINPGASSSAVVASVNGFPTGSFTPTGRLVVHGLAGDDDLIVSSRIKLPTWLYGDSGNDRLVGGGATNVLLGGAGDDTLAGDGDRDLLIGGAGADQLGGGGGDDILIAGSTRFDIDEAALAAILSEWVSTRPYATRVANLNGTGQGPRNNGAFFLTNLGTSATVYDDGAVDVLAGAAGQDWFFLDIDGDGNKKKKDKASDQASSEVAVDIDAIG